MITTAELADTFTILTNHRSSATGGGFTTHIEDIATIESSYTGVDLAEKVRNFIRDMYSNYGTQYVLLGGDCDAPPPLNPPNDPPPTQFVPCRGCFADTGYGYVEHNIPTDLYYGCLDGSWNYDGDADWGEVNDGKNGTDIVWYSEVYVGRIAADTLTEATNHITKIIAFETSTERPNKTLLAGEYLDDYPTWGGDKMDWLYSHMDSMPATRLYDKNGEWDAADILSAINSNEHHWVNHLGHSNWTYNMKMKSEFIVYNDTYHYDGHVELTTNSNSLLIYSQGCYPASMDNRDNTTENNYSTSDCFAEQVTNAYPDRGAFAYLGNSRYGWYNQMSVETAGNLAHKEFVEAILTDNNTRLGEANQISKTDLDLSWGMYRWLAFTTNLFGCPATDMSQLTGQCVGDQDCDDGLFCNGAETCDGSGVCQAGTSPSCNDGLYCTGVDSCNEETDQCVSSGDPCSPDTSICNEAAGQCHSVACFSDDQCNDALACTTDLCINPATAAAYCENSWPTCSLVSDGCCSPGCTPENDADCSGCGNDLCEEGEDCMSCPEDCISGGGDGFCGNGVCEPSQGENCLSCPADCRGKQVGASKLHYCCGGGDGSNPVGCEDPRCSEEGFLCSDSSPDPYCCGDSVCSGSEDYMNCSLDCPVPYCGDGSCNTDEDQCNCSTDCGNPPLYETNCTNSIDNDCDGLTDSADLNDCTCGARKAPCTTDDECCSNRCFRGACR